MLKDKPITTEFKTMLAFSLIFHIGIVLVFVYHSRLFSGKRQNNDDKMSFIWAAPVKKSKLQSNKNKMPPPIVAPQRKAPKEKKKARVVVKDAKKKVRKEKEKTQKKHKNDNKEAIAQALSDIYSELGKRKMPKADNYSREDLSSPGTGGSEKGIMDPERLSYIMNVKSLIESNWHVINKSIVKQLSDPKVLLTIKINSEGFIISKKVEKSSGNSRYDQSVLRAVERSDPLPPPPQSMMREALAEGITLDFEPPTD